jgi:hypothetical protein
VVGVVRKLFPIDTLGAEFHKARTDEGRDWNEAIPPSRLSSASAKIAAGTREIAAHREGWSLSWSKTSRTARERTPGENLFVVLVVIAPSSQELGPPANPGRFKATVNDRLREVGNDKGAADEVAVLREWLKLNAEETNLRKRLKEAEAELDVKALAQYSELSEVEIRTLVVADKWVAALDAIIHSEMERVSHQLTCRVNELAERYEATLPQMSGYVAELEG